MMPLMSKSDKHIKHSIPFRAQVRSHILSNGHHVVQTMTPVEGFTQANQKVVDAVEDELVTGLSPDQKEAVVQTGKDLLADQMKTADESDLSCLPSLAIEDIAVTAPSYGPLDPCLEGQRGVVTSQPTNGVVFFRALLDTAGPVQDSKYYPMFVSLLTDMGAGTKYDYR